MNYFTIREVAPILGVTERWLQMLCKQGRIPGAKRFNKHGVWLIPDIWIQGEQEKRKNMTNRRKEEIVMKKIAFVCDDVSEEIGKKIVFELEQKGVELHSKGVIPIYAHEDEDTIISSLYSIIHDSDMIIGVSSSGNGIAIYTNKIAGFTAVPIVSIDDIDEAIRIYTANAFDISAHNDELMSICKNLVERMGGTREME